MNSDIRIAIGFFDHPKTIKLQRRCGLEGVVSLLRLWEWAAQNRPSGELSGLDKEDIEIASKWHGEEGRFFDSICELHFIDVEGDKISLHDWAETNSWVASSEDRADKGRLNRMKSTNKDVYELLAAAGRTGISKKEYGLITSSKDKIRATQALLKGTLSETTSATQALLKGTLSETTSPSPTPTPTPMPSPSPSPIPSPIEKPPIVPQEGDGGKIPFKEIIGHLSEKTGKRFSHTSKASQRCIRGRWDEGYRLEDFVTVIDNMTDAWLGDKERDQYLRPSTLFGASKFEGYLNNKRKKEQNDDGLVY